MLKALLCPAFVLVCSCAVASAQNIPEKQAPAPAIAAGTAAAPDADQIESPSIRIGNARINFGVDLSFAMVQDETLRETMGRERQIKFAFANISVGGMVNEHLSFTVVINPVHDGPMPRPYVPSPTDRRTYFFPNQPDGRGVVSDPEGLYKVDDYKYSGFDPILQQGMLRVGFVDMHSKFHEGGRQYGAQFGRAYVPQGFGLDDVSWYTAKDLTHIQRINFQADNGIFCYFNDRRLRVNLAGITGNGNPYHDYGYFDFTDEAEDKNSALGLVAGARWVDPHYQLGFSYRKNYVNSRIEDSISVQLSKHNDNAIVVSASASPLQMIRVYGEYARYTWGLAATSAALLPGPANETPVIKAGYYVGVDVTSPKTPIGTIKGTFEYEELSRDDSLVAYAQANNMFGVTLGDKERTTIVKVESEVMKGLAIYGFWASESNPFPELSALKAISGAGSDAVPSGMRYGFGVRFKI
jgi:hypothetical protein